MQIRAHTVVAGVALLAAFTPAKAQLPQRYTNLQVLPAGISPDSLIGVMGGFTRALGVRCAHCHVARNGVRPAPDEYASDDRETKRVARVMLRMVRDINQKYLPETGRTIPSRGAVTCATCHGGVTRPRPLEAELLDAYDAFGLDATVATYRRLRLAHYGRSAYDFSDIALPTAADEIGRQVGRQRDAMALMQLNLEFNPQSWFTYQQMGQLQVAMGDTAAAVASLERALEINPGREFVKQLLESLRRKPKGADGRPLPVPH